MIITDATKNDILEWVTYHWNNRIKSPRKKDYISELSSESHGWIQQDGKPFIFIMEYLNPYPSERTIWDWEFKVHPKGPLVRYSIWLDMAEGSSPNEMVLKVLQKLESMEVGESAVIEGGFKKTKRRMK